MAIIRALNVNYSRILHNLDYARNTLFVAIVYY